MLVPRKSPTPIAPPSASIASWRSVSLRSRDWLSAESAWCFLITEVSAFALDAAPCMLNSVGPILRNRMAFACRRYAISWFVIGAVKGDLDLRSVDIVAPLVNNHLAPTIRGFYWPAEILETETVV